MNCQHREQYLEKTIRQFNAFELLLKNTYLKEVEEIVFTKNLHTLNQILKFGETRSD